jgi:hypothetical protein
MIPVTLASLLVLLLAAPARAGQTYDVSGVDSYSLGSAVPSARIVYAGTQHLSITVHGKERRYEATVQYTRTDDHGKASVRARFTQELNGKGYFDDLSDQDPDFLTILNQPFAVQLDRATLRGLQTLRGSVPFEATSPLGGAKLHGSLRHVAGGLVNGVPVIGVRFEAEGPMSGEVPKHPNAEITGKIRMDGTAYYAKPDALLLELDATLTIDGKLANGDNEVPVRITYHRVIRAVAQSITSERDRPRAGD